MTPTPPPIHRWRAFSLLALPVIFALVGRAELTDPVAETISPEAQPALVPSN